MAKSTDPFAADFTEHTPPTLHPLEMEGSREAPEGLLSWVVGLAQAHRVGPRTLVKHLVDQSDVHSDLWSDAAFFERHCGTVNGLGRYARMMLELVGKAATPAAQGMTLLGLAHLLPANGEGLLARNPRWCHACLCDQARRGQRPHHPLVWSFEHYRVCHVHRVSMGEHCPACGATQGYLPVYPSLLHCNACGESLIARPPGDYCPQEPEIGDFELWCAHALVDLVARTPDLQRDGSLPQMRINLQDIANRLTGGNRKELCEAIGLQPRAINGWMSKEERPSLALLLRLCYGVGLYPARVFLPDGLDGLTCARPIKVPSGKRQERPMLGYRQRERIERQLEMVLSQTDRHPSLREVAQEVGLSRHALKYWFRRQSSEIVRKNRWSNDRALAIRYQEDHWFLSTIVHGLQSDNVYPSRRRVNRELSGRHLSLMRPDLMHLYRRMRHG
jgi:transcriptional regulator with XRE-family HTH domain